MCNSKEEKINRQVELQKLYLRNMQIIKWRLKAIADIRSGATKTTFKMTNIGFCAICCTGISVTDIDLKGNSYLTSLPSVEIDYFAVDEEYRGKKLDETSTKYQTLSQAFFLYILEHIKNISINFVGATHICLYAVPKAVSFYKRCGFENFENYMNSDEIPFLDGCQVRFFGLRLVDWRSERRTHLFSNSKTYRRINDNHNAAYI